MSTLYLALGSNLGDKKANIRLAIQLIGSAVGQVTACSALLETEPWGFCSEHSFINAAVRVETTLSPQAVLEATQGIERRMGRTMKSTDGHYHDRIIDIDILLYDNLTVCEADLRIPHPLMFERDFVMRPLQEVLDDSGREIVEHIQKETNQPICK